MSKTSCKCSFFKISDLGLRSAGSWHCTIYKRVIVVRFHNIRACTGRGTKVRYVCVVLPGSQNNDWFKLLFRMCCHSAENGKNPRTCSSLDLATVVLSLSLGNSAGLAHVFRVETYSFCWALQKAAARLRLWVFKSSGHCTKTAGPCTQKFPSWVLSWSVQSSVDESLVACLGRGGIHSTELESSEMGDHAWKVVSLYGLWWEAVSQAPASHHLLEELPFLSLSRSLSLCVCLSLRASLSLCVSLSIPRSVPLSLVSLKHILSPS